MYDFNYINLVFFWVALLITIFVSMYIFHRLQGFVYNFVGREKPRLVVTKWRLVFVTAIIISGIVYGSVSIVNNHYNMVREAQRSHFYCEIPQHNQEVT